MVPTVRRGTKQIRNAGVGALQFLLPEWEEWVCYLIDGEQNQNLSVSSSPPVLCCQTLILLCCIESFSFFLRSPRQISLLFRRLFFPPLYNTCESAARFTNNSFIWPGWQSLHEGIRASGLSFGEEFKTAGLQASWGGLFPSRSFHPTSRRPNVVF